MKTLILAAAALIGSTTAIAAAPAAAQVNQRQWNQQQRIYHGARSGRLTSREYYRLQRQQRRIARYEARSRWDGGGLSRHERVRLSRMQNRANRNIYRQKHDWQRRGYTTGYGPVNWRRY